MSGKYGIHSPRAYPKITPRSIVYVGASSAAYGLGVDRRGVVFTYTPASTTEHWPEWAGIPAPGVSTWGDPYEVRLDVVSGLAPIGPDPVGTWLSLTANRQWENFPAVGVNISVWRISLRRAFAGTDPMAIANYSFSITRV